MGENWRKMEMGSGVNGVHYVASTFLVHGGGGVTEGMGSDC